MEEPVNHLPQQEEDTVMVAAVAAAAVAALEVVDYPTMTLTAPELERVEQIKQAFQERHQELELKPLTDFEYVQYAMCTRDESMERVLHRMTMMQAFREEYKIRDTVEEGVELIDLLTKQHPGFLLAIEYVPSTQNFITVDDWAAFFPSRVVTSEDRRVFMGALYYKFQAKLNQFHAIRQGASSLIECMGCSMDNFDLAFFERVLHEFYHWYPKSQKEFFLINSPYIVNVVISLWKRYMYPDERRATKLGHQIHGLEGQRIDILYKIPTPEAGRQQLLGRMQQFLTVRYQNQKDFVLPKTTTATLQDDVATVRGDPALEG